MKKLLLLTLLLLLGALAFAQKNDTNAHLSSAKIKIVSGPLMNPSNDILENISLSPELTILAIAIKTSGLATTFKGSGPITVFAPTNKAFEKFNAVKLDTLLLPAHKNELVGLLTYHVIAGKITSKDIEKQIKANNGQAIFKTLSGGQLTARTNENRNIVLTDENGGQSVISKLDIQQSYGMLHIITGVLVPKSK